MSIIIAIKISMNLFIQFLLVAEAISSLHLRTMFLYKRHRKRRVGSNRMALLSYWKETPPALHRSWRVCGRHLWEQEYNYISIRSLKTIRSCRDYYKMYCDKFCNIYPLLIILLLVIADLLQYTGQRTNTLLDNHIYPMPFELKPKKILFPHKNSRSLAIRLSHNCSQ